MLHDLAPTGLSNGQIAKTMQKAGFDVSRNAVIGKLNRAGVSTKFSYPKTKKRKPKIMPPKKLAHKRPAVPVFAPEPVPRTPYEELVIPLDERASILTLTDASCRWPIGDPQHAEFHFCGKGKLDGLPYCEFHARRAFQPATRTTATRTVTALRRSA